MMSRQLLLTSFIIAVSSLSAGKDLDPCSKQQWQCSDGTCIWNEAKCNGIVDCPDASDETQSNCQIIGGSKPSCVMPHFPEHGTYRANEQGNPGDRLYYLNINVTCHLGYKVVGVESVHCYNGWWPEPIAKCVYAGGCGIISENVTELEKAGGKETKRGHMPWHVDFYIKPIKTRHACSGSLIRDDVVVSVSSCFWITYPYLEPKPVNDYLAQAGNRYYEYNHSDDTRAQQSPILQFHFADYVPGVVNTIHLNNPVLVILAKPFVFNEFIRPVCIDFNIHFDRRQLQLGRKGKLGTWGLTKKQIVRFNATYNVVDFSFVDSDTCILESQEIHRKFGLLPRPENRICAEYTDGDVFHCLPGYDDYGSGLVYPEQESEDVQRYYLRGVLWKLGDQTVSPSSCGKVEGYVLFTKIQSFEEYIKKHFKADVAIDTRVNSKCILPPYPAKGRYVANIPNAKPGDGYDVISINISCQEGFVANGPHMLLCSNGEWSSEMPKCVPQCRLAPNPSVEYRCLVSLEWMDGFRACNEYEPSDTLVSPVCKTHYYSATALKFMHCIDGEWYNVPKCTPECGTLTPNGTQLVIGGEPAQVGEVPWHAGIYTKMFQPFKQICGGSLISNKVVLSAAHCFWNNLVGKLPASDFAVALGKLHRRWDSKLDLAQKFDVQELHIPTRFQGSAASFQDDIAVLVLSSTVVYKTYIRPVCIDFDINFERKQLQPPNKGKVSGWGLTAETDANGSQVLRVVDLPYVTIATCIRDSPESFRAHITSDKICAGYKNAGIALCKGDSGGGLAFLELDKGIPRFYLRGVASTAPTSDNLCNSNTYTSFTRLINHEHLITKFWGD